MTRNLLIVSAFVLVTSSAQAQEPHHLMTGLRLAAIGTMAGDLSTTATVLRQGGREMNGALRGATLVKTAAIDGATLGGIYVLEAKHPKVATVLYLAVIATRGFATAHNARAIR